MKASRIIVIVLLLGVATLLLFMNFKSVTTPIHFENQFKERKTVIVEHLIDLRSAQNEYHKVYSKYTDSPDSLILFLQTTPIKTVYKEKALTDNHFENHKLNEDKVAKIIDSAKKKALSNKKLNLDPNDIDALYAYIWANDKDIIDNELQGFRRDTIEANMIDSLYHGRYDAESIVNLPIMPFSKDNEHFVFKVDNEYPTNQGNVALFEMMAPYESFLWDLDAQELANFIDKESKKEIKRIDPNGYMNLTNKDVVVGLKVGDVESPNGGQGNWDWE